MKSSILKDFEMLAAASHLARLQPGVALFPLQILLLSKSRFSAEVSTCLLGFSLLDSSYIFFGSIFETTLSDY